MFKELRRIKIMEIITEIFEDIGRYENKYGIAIPPGAYMNIKDKWRRKFER